MARFYGTIQGARGPAYRLGHASSGLRVTAQSWQGDIVVELHADNDADRVYIEARSHRGSEHIVLYHGPITELLDDPKTIVRRFAERELERQYGERDTATVTR
jgi:hypothetical protein